MSLAGQPIEGLSVVAGAVLLDAEVAGEAVDLGTSDPSRSEPPAESSALNFDYRLPFFRALSVDLGITNQAAQVASALRIYGARRPAADDRAANALRLSAPATASRRAPRPRRSGRRSPICSTLIAGRSAAIHHSVSSTSADSCSSLAADF